MFNRNIGKFFNLSIEQFITKKVELKVKVKLKSNLILIKLFLSYFFKLIFLNDSDVYKIKQICFISQVYLTQNQSQADKDETNSDT